MKVRKHSMLWAVILALAVIMTACEKFPNNPPMDGPDAQVEIKHLGTEYMNSKSPDAGLVADKVNVLTFEIKSNMSADAFEILGRAVLEGPPEGKEHVLHFRTDQVLCTIDGCELMFNTIRTIQTGDVHQIVRPKFPTNEYAPFLGSQGKIQSIEITEIWALDGEGGRTQVEFSLSEK